MKNINMKSVLWICAIFGKDLDLRIRTTDPALFVRSLQKAYYFLKLQIPVHYFFKIKSHKIVTKQ